MITNCNDCIHYDGLATCDAFPDGIPIAILAGEQSHDVAVDDDNGILYEPYPDDRDDEDKAFDAWMFSDMPSSVTYTDSFNAVINSFRQDDKPAKCTTGKPCRTKSGNIICIPKNATCHGQETGKPQRNKRRIIAAGAIAAGAVGVGLLAFHQKSNSDPAKIATSDVDKGKTLLDELKTGNAPTVTFIKGKKNTSVTGVNGIPFTEIKETPDFAKIQDTPLREPPFEGIPGKAKSSGIVIVEEDNRVWLVEPTNHYGGYINTFPKGRLEPELTTQQNAHKEVFEESGLTVNILDYLGDFPAKTTVGRYYMGKRTGGSPLAYGWETQGVRLANLKDADKLVNNPRDRALIDAVKQRVVQYEAEPVQFDASGLPASIRDIRKMSAVKELPGSTKPVLVRDNTSKSMFVVKKGGNRNHVKEEATADAIYRAIGVPTPNSKIYDTGDTVYKASEFLEGTPLNKVSGSDRKAALAQAQQHFAADALLANWDVHGQGGGNLFLEKSGVVHRIDNGGSLRYRAKGRKKARFGSIPIELWSMRQSGNAAAPAFRHMKWSKIERQMGTVASQKENILAQVKGDRNLHKTLSNRIENMDALYKASKELRGRGMKESDVEDFLKLQARNQGANVLLDSDQLIQKGAKYV